MTLIQEQKERYEKNRQLICDELKWSLTDYAYFQWEMMEAYIKYHCGKDGLSFLGESKVYRQWWVNQWNIRDIANVQTIITLPTLRERRMCYEFKHSAEYLHRTYVKRRVLQEGEATVIGRAIDQHHKQVKVLAHV